MINSLKMAKAFFESKGMPAQEFEQSESVLMLSFKGENTIMKIILDFTEDGQYVTIKSYSLCTFPADKLNGMYKLCSELNKDYKWVKFYVDESDNTLTAQDDAIIQLDSCGEECFELVGRMVTIIDDVYPRMMRAIWQ